MAADWQLDTASIEDIPALLHLWREVPGIGLGRGDDPPSLQRFLERNAATCLVVRSGDRVRAGVLGGFDGRRGFIYHLAVHPDWQGRGLGRALVEEVTARLWRLGAQKVHLFVYPDNLAARRFYRRLGWVERGDIVVVSWDGGPGRTAGPAEGQNR